MMQQKFAGAWELFVRQNSGVAICEGDHLPKPKTAFEWSATLHVGRHGGSIPASHGVQLCFFSF